MGRHEVVLAAPPHVVARLTQQPKQIGFAALGVQHVEHRAVAARVRIPAGHEAAAAGGADRVLAEGVAERHGVGRGEAVEVGSDRRRVAQVAHRVGAPLVGVEEDDVGPGCSLGHAGRLLPIGSPWERRTPASDEETRNQQRREAGSRDELARAARLPAQISGSAPFRPASFQLIAPGGCPETNRQPEEGPDLFPDVSTHGPGGLPRDRPDRHHQGRERAPVSTHSPGGLPRDLASNSIRSNGSLSCFNS